MMATSRIHKSKVRTPPGFSSPWKSGDVVVEWGTGGISRLIECWTWGWVNGFLTFGPSHVGIVVDSALVDAPVFWESSFGDDLEPCGLLCSDNNGVHQRPLDCLSKRPGRVWRLPLLNPLSATERRCLYDAAIERHRAGYDFEGCALAGTHWLKRLFWRRAADRKTFFCSELVGQLLQSGFCHRRQFPAAEWGHLSPRELVAVLQETGLYGDLVRIK